jgi:hypothetical protein
MNVLNIRSPRATAGFAVLALSLNAVFAWAAFKSTATVPPLRVWEKPTVAGVAAAHLALDSSARLTPAALVE